MTTQTTHVSLPIRGMTCASCVNHIQQALQSLKGVTDVTVNLATEMASVDFNPTITSPKLMAQVIEASGYEVSTQSQTITIGGMTCASCVNHVEKALATIPGVISANVNLATHTAKISTNAGPIPITSLQEVITNAGYTLIPQPDKEGATGQNNSEPEENNTQLLFKRAILSGSLGLFVMLVTMNILPGISSLTPHTRHIGLFFITSFGLILAGRPIFMAAWKAAIHYSMNMNSLIAVGTLAAFGYSSFATFIPSLFQAKGIPVVVYYDTSLIIIALILFGRYLEARAKQETSSSIHSLMRLQPKTARVRRGNEDKDTLIDLIQTGELIVIRPGEQIPVDGEITEGHAFVNEAMLTGESLPIEKGPGSTVYTGTINLSGSFLFTASSIGADTVLARIVHLVQEAQGSKPPIQRFADYVASIFVPTVMGIATLAFSLWWGFGPEPALTYATLTFVAVLIIACPCALGLATPTAIMVGTGRGAEQGILIRQGEALEVAHQIDTIVFDKTGTLTTGVATVTDVIAPEGNQKELIRLAASLERGSEHPLAQAIVKYATHQSLELEESQDFRNTPGQGVMGTVNSQSVIVGNLVFMTAHLGPISDEKISDSMRQLSQKGKTPILVAINGKINGCIGIADTIRPESKAVIQELQNAGLEVIMLTGDHRQVAEAIASTLGISQVFADILPDHKTSEILKLQQQGQKRVAMVGDGINDAPALAQADLGMAIGTGTDVAMETAQITLMSGNLHGVTRALQLSRATMRTIYQNLFWAFAYNIALIPIAAGILYPVFQEIGGVPQGLEWIFGEYGFLQPIMAATAMALSSVSVVANSLRLRNISLA